jgi:hypothetical protein
VDAGLGDAPAAADDSARALTCDSADFCRLDGPANLYSKSYYLFEELRDTVTSTKQ